MASVRGSWFTTAALLAMSTSIACGSDDETARQSPSAGGSAGAAGSAATGATGTAGAGATNAGAGGSGGSAGSGGSSGGGSVVAGAAGQAVTGPTLEIWIVGDTSETTIDDGNSGQTPSSYLLGIERFDLMLSEDDPDPVTVFDVSPDYVEVDMLSSTLLTTVSLLDVPPAYYSHGKALLAMTRFDVETTAHPRGAPLPDPPAIPGTASVLAALSDTEIDGTPRSQGWAQYTFHIPSLADFDRVGTLPDLPSSGAGTVVQENDETWIVFELGPNLTINASITQPSYVATVTYQVYESFRWQDTRDPGYQPGVFDCETDGSTELVTNFGATDYQITVD